MSWFGKSRYKTVAIWHLSAIASSILFSKDYEYTCSVIFKENGFGKRRLDFNGFTESEFTLFSRAMEAYAWLEGGDLPKESSDE